MSDQLTTEEVSTLKKNAEAYFKEQGIDPSKKPEKQSANIDRKDLSSKSIITHPCFIRATSYLVYTYIEVLVPAIGYTFKGSSGGLGIGDIGAAGVIYYTDEAKLLSTEAFGVVYGAEYGGVLQVTWGSHGNATAAGIGEGGGAFGGSGKWEKN